MREKIIILSEGKPWAPMNLQTARYVILYRPQYLTQKERRAWDHVIATDIVEMYRNLVSKPEEPFCVRELIQDFSQSFSTDSEVLQPVLGGREAFLKNTAARILRDHGSEIYLNRCPRCGQVTVTPRSRQCRYCRHDWYD